MGFAAPSVVIGALLTSGAFAQTNLPNGNMDRTGDEAINEPLPTLPEDQRTDMGVVEVERALERAQRGTPVSRTPPQRRVDTVMERDRPELRAPGIHLGGFTLFPSAGTGLLADTNVFRTNKGASDVALVTEAAAVLQSNWSRNALKLQGEVENRTYARFWTEDVTEYEVSTAGRLDVFRDSTFTAGLTHGRFAVDRGAAGEIQRTAEPIRVERTLAEVRAKYPGVKVGAELAMLIDSRDYKDARNLSGGVVDQQFRDYNRKTVSARADFRNTVNSSIFVQIKRDWVDLRLQADPDGDRRITAAYIGYQGEISPLVRVSATAGLLKYEFHDPALRDRTRPAFDAKVDWTPTPLTTVHLFGRRDVQDRNDRNTVAETRTVYGVGADHELLRNLVVSANIERQVSDFPAVAGSDKRWRESVGARWQLNRNLTATVQVRAEQRDYSSRPTFDFEAYQVRAGVRLTF